ncbi:MAG: hypothetical protein ACXU9A_25805 [Xanthobacteraceae bacterium]
MSWYALEKLADAAAVVENGGASVRTRLFRAFHHLQRVRPEDMPDGDLRRAFVDIMVALTTEEAQGSEGRLVATLKVMDDEDAENIARGIVDLCDALDRLLRER